MEKNSLEKITPKKRPSRTTLRHAVENLVTTADKARLGTINMDAPLTAKQRAFVENLAVHQLNQSAAARHAGYTGHASVTAANLLANPKIQQAIAERRAEFAAASQVTKKMVVDGFLEAIEMAKLKADPLTMVSGWREVGKICGFYEPTKTEINVTIGGRLMIRRMQEMSDEELLAMAESTDVVDVIAREVAEEDDDEQ